MRPVRIPHMPRRHKKHCATLILNNENYGRTVARNRRLQSRRRAADDPAAGSHRTDHRRTGGAIPWPLRHRGGRHGGARHSDLDAPPAPRSGAMAGAADVLHPARRCIRPLRRRRIIQGGPVGDTRRRPRLEHSWPRTATGKLELKSSARQAGQASSRVETVAAPARPDRRIAVGSFPQHRWRRWL